MTMRLRVVMYDDEVPNDPGIKMQMDPVVESRLIEEGYMSQAAIWPTGEQRIRSLVELARDLRSDPMLRVTLVSMAGSEADRLLDGFSRGDGARVDEFIQACRRIDRILDTLDDRDQNRNDRGRSGDGTYEGWARRKMGLRY